MVTTCNGRWTMNWQVACLVVVMLITTTRVNAQHADIALYQDSAGQVVTFDTANAQQPSRVFQRSFDFWGSFGVFAGDDPGFQQAGTNPPAGFASLPGNTTVSLNLVPLHLPGQGIGNLLFWDGTTPEVEFGAVPDQHLFYVEDASGITEVALDSSLARFEQLTAGATDSHGGMHQHLTFAVENNGLNPSEGVYLMGWEMSVPGLEKSQLMVVGLSAPTLSSAVRSQSSSWLIANIDSFRVAGDFDGNGVYELNDVDALVEAIASGDDLANFDLTLDGRVDTDDLQTWQTIAGSVLYNTTTVPGEPTNGAAVLAGDANLDGVVDVSDFNIWNSNKLAPAPAWSAGDFNADGFVDVSDFNIWNSYKFRSVAPAVSPRGVPEPSVSVFVLACLCLAFLARRNR